MLQKRNVGALVGTLLAVLSCGEDHDDGKGTGGAGGTGGTGGTGGAAVAGKGGSVSGAGGTSGASKGGAAGGGGSGTSGSGGGAGASTGGGAGGAGGAGARGGNAGTGVAGNPTAGRGGDAGAADGGEPGGDCTGTFGNERVLVTGPVNINLGNPSLPADGLELFVTEIAEPGQRFFHATRASTDDEFGELSAVPELDAPCTEPQNRSISVSPDGLRAYVTCYLGPDLPAPLLLYVARRPKRDGAWVFDDMTYGNVGAGAAISPDELTLVSSSEEDSIGRMSAPREYTRESTSEPFANGQTIVSDPGPDDYFLSAPSLAPDGLTVFGTLFQGVGIAVRDRVDQPFSAPTLLLPAKDDTVYGAPEVSPDCRTLYYVRIDPPTSDNRHFWHICSSSR